MKNKKKLFFGLIALFLCICVLVPLGIRLAWCKVTFVCKDGCEHVVWHKIGEVADATIVINAHKDDYLTHYVMGSLHTDKEMLLSYLGEPLTSPSKKIYVNEWMPHHHLIKITFDTPYGELLYHISQSSKAEEVRLLDSLIAMGGDPNASYTFEWWDPDYPSGIWYEDDFATMIKKIIESTIPLPRGAAYTDIYTGNVGWEFVVKVSLSQNQ